MKKWKDKGYWAAQQFYWQSLLYYFGNCIRFRSITFFSAANPAMSMGGMLDDNKTEAYDLIDEKYIPTTIIYNHKIDLASQLSNHDINFPVIVKPNIGLKGFAVKKCINNQELSLYLAKVDISRAWLIQEFVEAKGEYSIMYYRYPYNGGYGVSSICRKEYPYLEGDGQSTIAQLISNHNNPYLDKDSLLAKWNDKSDYKLPRGEKMILHQIGNYSRGSKFYSEMIQNDDRLVSSIHNIFMHEPNIGFCRFDIKAESLSAVKNGEFKIMEVNGAKGEPIHIYDPQYSFLDRWKDISTHWDILIKIIKERRNEENFQFPTTKAGLKSLITIKQLMK